MCNKGYYVISMFNHPLVSVRNSKSRRSILNLRNVLTLCKIGSPVYLILFHNLILTVLPKAVTTKLKFLKEMHTVTKISEDSETAFYIYFLINCPIKNKQLPNSNCLHSNFHFNSLSQLLTKSLFCFSTHIIGSENGISVYHLSAAP